METHESPFVLPQDVPPPLQDAVQSLHRVINDAAGLRRHTQKILHFIARCTDIIEDIKTSIHAQLSDFEEMIKIMESVRNLEVLLIKADYAVNKEKGSSTPLKHEMIATWESSRNEFRALLNQAYGREFKPSDSWEKEVEQVARIDDYLWVSLIAQNMGDGVIDSDGTQRAERIATRLLREEDQVTRDQDIEAIMSSWDEPTADLSAVTLHDDRALQNPLSKPTSAGPSITTQDSASVEPSSNQATQAISSSPANQPPLSPIDPVTHSTVDQTELARTPLRLGRGSGSDQGGSAGRFQPSTESMEEWNELAKWRIDPARIEFPEDPGKHRAGFATVSRALLIPEPGNEEALKYTGHTGGESKSDSGTYKRKAIAVKMMKIGGDLERVLGLTIREAGFLAELSHENIIELEGFVEDVSRNILWLVFLWAENGNLRDFLCSQEWEIPERISLIQDVTKGVEYLHSRSPPICHGDLKSVNVLVNSNCRAVITGFGSARRLIETDTEQEAKAKQIESREQPVQRLEASFCASTSTITLAGDRYTLRWAAPELLQDEERSLKSDIWPLGWIVYEAMTNTIPFEDVGTDAVVIDRVVRGDFSSVTSHARLSLVLGLCSRMVQCWNIDPSKRPTARELRKSIELMPMVVPDPQRTSGLLSPELLMELGDMYRYQDDLSNASRFFNEALGIYAGRSDDAGRASALRALARVCQLQSKYGEAAKLYSEALQISSEIGDRGGRANALQALGRVYCLRNEYNEAVTLYSEALQISTDSGDRNGRANALHALGEVHRIQNEYSKAATLYSEALEILTDIGDRRRGAYVLQALGEVHQLQNDYSKAITLYSEALQISTDIGDRQGRAEALQVLGEVHRLQNKYSQAATFYAKALEIRSEIGDRLGRADALQGLGEVHRLQNKYSDAIALYSEALEIRTDIGDRHGRAGALVGLAKVHWLQSEYSEAITLYSEALEISTDIGDRYGKADALQGLGEVYRLRNEYSHAATLYSRALEIRTDICDRRGRADALQGFGKVHWLQSEYDEAITLYSEALQISTDIGDRHGKADALQGLGEVHRLRNEYSEAIVFYSKALEIRTEIGDRRGRADALQGLGEVNRLQNEYQEAIALCSEALEIRTDIGDRHGRAAALVGLAKVQWLQSEYSEAITLCSEALRISTDIGDRHGKADALQGIGEVHRLQNEYSEAITLYSEALEIRTDIDDRHGKANALCGLGEVYQARSEYNQAIHHFSEAQELSIDIGDTKGEGYALLRLADLYREQDRYSDAEPTYRQAAEIFRQIGNNKDATEALSRAAVVRQLELEQVD